MNNIVFEIARFDGEKEYVQTYHMPYQSGKTVLWWLKRLQQEQDSSLTLVISCRAGLCGACSLCVNGKPILACEVVLDTLLLDSSLPVTIEPLRHFPVIRDLMVDWHPTIARMKAVQQWLEPASTCDGGCLQTPAEYQAVKANAACIACGICASACPALEHDGFIEPFLFTKAQRFIVDSRSSECSHAVILQAVEPYLAKCLHCRLCEKACPKGVSPIKAIEFLAEKAADMKLRV